MRTNVHTRSHCSPSQDYRVQAIVTKSVRDATGAYHAQIKSETARYARIVKEAGIKAD